jgi:hypothetical protein
MTDPATHGIVPPYLNEHWRQLREHLRVAGVIADQAAQMATVEDVRPMLGLAMMELTDASFSMYCLERDVDEPLPGVDP